MTLAAFIFISGVLVGFLAGIAFSDAVDLIRSRSNPHPLGEHPMRRVAGYLADKGRTLILFVVIVGNLGLGALLIQQRAASEDFVKCSANYNAAFASSYSARSKAAADVSGAMDQIVMAIGKRDSDGFGESIANYVHLRQEQNKQRAKSPLPEPPQQVCGDPE